MADTNVNYQPNKERLCCSTSVRETTIDEAPEVCEPIEDIIDPISEAVDIIDAMKPIYNFKAS